MKVEDSKIKKPEKSKQDTAHTLVKAGLSAIPIAGGPAAELFSMIITSPLEKRRDQWIESIANGLKDLQKKVDNFDIENLADNELFITTVMQASQIAIRNHQEIKLQSLSNAILNTAIRNTPEEDVQLIFLNLVDTYTPWHLKTLKFFQNPQEWGKSNEIKYPKWEMGPPSAVLEHAFPELKGKRHFYDLIIRKLHDDGLLNIEHIHTSMSAKGMFEKRTTDFGDQFIDFITYPL